MVRFGLYILRAEQSLFLGSEEGSKTGCNKTTRTDQAPQANQDKTTRTDQAPQANLGSMAPEVPVLGNDENERRGSLSPLRPVSDDDLLVWYRLVSEQQVIFRSLVPITPTQKQFVAVFQHPEGLGVSSTNYDGVAPFVLPVLMYNKGTNNFFVSDFLEDIDKSQTVYFPREINPIDLRKVPENASEAAFLPLFAPTLVSTQVVAGLFFRFQWEGSSFVLEVFRDLEDKLMITGILKATGLSRADDLL